METGAAEERVLPKVVAFFAIAAAWVALDQYTKSFFAGMQPAGIIAGPFAGLIDIRLVHNTGGAWGIFSDSTFGLGLFSVAVCAAITVAFLIGVKGTTALQTVALSLIAAGGAGNAIDRFTQGFVTDFLEFSFIDFPVFNVADIGVTGGFALLLLGIALSMRKGGA